MSENIYPERWRNAALGFIATFEMGQAPKGASCNFEGVGDVFVKAGEFGAQFPIIREWTTEPLKYAKQGDVLICVVGATAGKINLGIDCSIGRSVAAIRPSKHLSQKYLYRYLQSQITKLKAGSTGSAQGVISKSDLEKLAIPFTSYAEQKVIADKLDTLLAQVESIKARLERIPEILKQFRQSVLAAAVSGKLTEGEKKGEEHEWQEVATFALDIRYGTSKKCSQDSGETPVLRIPNIGLGVVDHDDLKYADFDKKELETLRLQKGDLLIIRSNGSVDLVGKLAIISESDEHCLFAGYLIRLRLDPKVVDSRYVAYCLQSPQLRQVIELIARSTSGVNNINSKELLGLKIPVPLLDEQREIIERIEKLHSFSESIEKQVQSALDRVSNLTQSILAKAFRGELTAEWREANPELISGENSAEALLKRIKAERESAKPTTKRGRGKA